MAAPLVGVIMGSDSDLPVMKAACEMLAKFEVPYECTIVSAHRTPNLSSISQQAFMTGRSLSEPMMTPTSGGVDMALVGGALNRVLSV